MIKMSDEHAMRFNSQANIHGSSVSGVISGYCHSPQLLSESLPRYTTEKWKHNLSHSGLGEGGMSRPQSTPEKTVCVESQDELM